MRSETRAGREVRMQRAGSLLVALSIAIAFPAAPKSSFEVALQDFELLGTWAPDCSEPPSPIHPHATYTIPSSGQGSMTYDAGSRSPGSAYTILSAERISDDKLLLREEWLHDHSRLEVTVRKFRGKVKVWLSRDADGKLLVKDGVVVATGYVSPWMMRCP